MSRASKPPRHLGGSVLTIVVAAFIVAGSIALGAQGAAREPRLVVAATTGEVAASNSHEGSAILSAESMRPADAAVGTVTIANLGDAHAAATLSASHISDTPGPLGGSLAARLLLTVDDVSDPQRPVRVFQGAHAALGGVSLRTYAPGEDRQYRFTARLPDGGRPSSATTGDNVYAGASMSAQYNWGMVATDPPPPPPPPSPVAPAAPPARPPVKPTLPPAGRLPVISRRTLRVSRNGIVRMPIACPGPADCQGTLRLLSGRTVKTRAAEAEMAKRGRRLRGRRVIARGRFNIRAKRSANVRVRLSRRGRRLVRRTGRLRVRASISTTDAAGRRSSSTSRIRLTAPRSKRSGAR